MTPEQIVQIIESLSQVAQQVYGWAVDYVVADATMDLVGKTLFLMIVVAVSAVAWRYGKSENDKDWCEIAVFVTALTAVFFVISVSSDIAHLIAPEWPALEMILDTAK